MIAKLKFDIEQTSDDYNVYQSTIIRTPIIITEDDDEVIKPKSLNELRKYMTCGTKVVFQLDLEKTTLSYDDDDLLCHRMSHHFVISRITITKPRAYADKKESTDFSDDDMEQVASSGKTLAERMRLKTQKARVIFSNVQYLPVITTAMRIAVTTTKVIQTGTPKIFIAAVMPMYSVTSVSRLITARSNSENQPQNGPKASKIASACPRFVTAPRRTVISWT